MKTHEERMKVIKDYFANTPEEQILLDLIECGLHNCKTDIDDLCDFNDHHGIRHRIIMEFMRPIADKYGDLLYIKYFYDEDCDLHYVYHTNRELEFSDREFRKFTGQLMSKLSDEYNTRDLAFNYDADFAYQVKLSPPPYSCKDYVDALSIGYDLDDWNDYQKFYGLGEQEDEH